MRPPIFEFTADDTGLSDPAKCRTNYTSLAHVGSLEIEDGIRQALPHEVPDFWSVYGLCPNEEQEWVADFANELQCLIFMAVYSNALGIPTENIVLNFTPLQAAAFMMNTPTVMH